MRYAAISVNFDSLGEVYGFPAGYEDPVFHAVFDRFQRLAEKWGLTYSIYVIGKDLANPSNRAIVRDWAGWARDRQPLVYASAQPRGPAARRPARRDPQGARVHRGGGGPRTEGVHCAGLVGIPPHSRVLAELGYRYDTSVWPSLLMYPAVLKLALNLIGDRRFLLPFTRRDLHYPCSHRAAQRSYARRTAPSSPCRCRRIAGACRVGTRPHFRSVGRCTAPSCSHV